MSTKTTLKRIALVAVSALGFGLLSVAPSGAAYTASAISLGTPTSLNAAVAGVAHHINVPITIPTTALSTDTMVVSAVLTARPASSSRALNTAGNSAPVTAIAGVGNATVKTSLTTITVTQDSTNSNSANIALGAQDMNNASNASSYTVNLQFNFTPDVAGTYNIAFFIDGSATVSPTGLIKSGDRSIRYHAITAASQPATAVVMAQPLPGSIAVLNAGDLPNGGWVRLHVTNGTDKSHIDLGQQVLVSIPTGITLQAVAGDGAATTGLSLTNTTYALSESNFDRNGNVFLNFVSSAAATYTISASVSGSSVAATTLALTFFEANKNGTAGAATDATTDFSGTRDVGTSTGAVTADEAITVNSAATTNSFTVYAAGADASTTSVTNYVGVTVEDTNNFVFGDVSTTALKQDLAVALGSTAGATANTATNAKVTGSFSIPVALTASRTSTENRYLINVEDAITGDALPTTVKTVVTPAAAASTTGILLPAASVRVVNGGSITFTFEVDDQYGAARAGVPVTAQITAGRNLQAAATNLVTDASGIVSFTVTDAAPTSTTTTSTVTFTTSGISTGNTATITWVAALSASAMTTNPSATTEATVAQAKDLGAISTSGTASSGRDTISATVTDANGIAIAGLPVTLTLPADVSLHTGSTLVAYTDSTGVASWSVFTTKAGTYAFTFTGGGLTRTSYGKWSGGSARVVSVTAGTTVGDVTPITIKAADAYGNGVGSTALTVSTDGGYFQGAALSSSINTDVNGEIRLMLVGNGTVTATGTATQMYSAAGISSGTTAAAGFPAGVATASAKVSGAVSAAADAANAAADAAAEAIDAANAATDAANLAAEAADAATVAAEEARDAADAATAAVEELATQVATLMAALKAQITTLANTVAKIAKKVRA